MSAILTNQCGLLAEWWGGNGRDYGWFIVPTNAANVIYGPNPPYQVSDFLAFYPKFGSGVQGLVQLQVTAGISELVPDPTAPGQGYLVNDQLTIMQQGAAGGMAIVTAIDENGAIAGLALQQSGLGYAVAMSVPVVGGSGTGALVNITEVDALGGEGYEVGDQVTVLQLGASGGIITVDAVDSDGAVTALEVSIPGNGYSLAPGVPTVGGSGSGLQVGILQISPFNTLVPPIVIQTFINLATNALMSARWLNQWLFGMHLFVAHYCTLWLQSEGDPGSTAGQVAQSGLMTGVTISKNAGDVSISKQQIVEDHLSQFSAWLLTTYGQQLAQIASAVGSGAMYIY